MEEKEQGPKKSDGNSIYGGGWWWRAGHRKLSTNPWAETGRSGRQ